MPLPPVPTGFAASTVTTPIGTGSAVITPEIAQRLQTLYDQYAMMGQQAPFEVPQVGEDATQFLTNMYFGGDSGFATELAEKAGLNRDEFLANVRRVNEESQGRRGSNVFGAIGNLTRVGRGEVDEPLDFFRDAATLGAIGYGTSFLPGGGAAAGEAGAAGTAATTFPYVAGGPVTVSAIPGVTAGTTAATIGAGAGLGAKNAAKQVAKETATNALTSSPKWTDWLPQITGGVNALLGANAADKAADAESAGLQAAIEEQRRQFDLSRQDAMPWLTAGQNALNNLQDPNAFTASPGYEWLRSEGMRDIGNSFAARGGAASGNALRALSEFQTGLAAQDYNNFWNRQAGLAGVGQNTAVNLGSLGANAAGNIGNALANQGASRASGVMGKYGSLAQGLNQGVSNWLYRRRTA